MKSLLGLVSFMCFSMSAFAQLPPEQIDIKTLINLIESSPRLSLERQDIAVAEAERLTAGSPPNPTINVYQSNQPSNPNRQTNFTGNRARDISVDLPLLLGGQRGARINAADHNIEAVRAQVSANANAIAADVGVAYVDLLLAQKKSAMLLASLEELHKLRTIVAARHTNGLASKYELLRVDVEQVTFTNQVIQAQTELVDRQAQLAILTGFPDWHPKGNDELSPFKIEDIEKNILSESPEVVAAMKAEEASQARIEVAQRERFPNISLHGDRYWTSDPFGYTYTLGLAVEVPIFDTRIGALNRAKAEADAAGLKRYLAENKLKADIQNYSSQVTQKTRALERFQSRAGARLVDLKQMAEDSYRLGRSSITELLDATRARCEIQISEIELVAGLMQSQIRLLAAQGLLLKAFDEIQNK